MFDQKWNDGASQDTQVNLKEFNFYKKVLARLEILNYWEEKSSFLKNLEIHLGQNDNNPNDPFLNTTDGANLQGSHRLSRGKYFILNSDSIAQNMNFSSNWIKKEVPNVGHQQVNMAAFAAQELF